MEQPVSDHSVPDRREQDRDVADFSAREHLSELIANTRQLVDIEIDFYRARLSYSQKLVKRAGLFGIVAMSFLFAAIVALVLGILLIVAATLSPELATLAVSGGFILMALIFGWLARSNLQRLNFPEFSEDAVNEPE
jgi:Flp pilus assembly protein TadB